MHWRGAILVLLIPLTAHAAWFDANFAFRRPIDITWDDERSNGDDLSMIEFYTAGHVQPKGEDIRVATEDGKLVASRVLQIGPGDRARVIFNMQKSERKYFVYFGNPKPEPPPPELADVRYRRGMLFEIKQWTGGAVDNFKQMEDSWNRSKPLIGRTMIERPFLGINPLGEQNQTIAKYTGTLYVPADGEYTFAVGVDDRAAVYLDDTPLIFATITGDARFTKTIKLTKGPHEMSILHLDFGGATAISVCWKHHDIKEWQAIPRDSFGIVYGGVVGPLEEHNKSLTADFSCEYQGECFFHGVYTHRYKFTARSGKTVSPPKYEWDFGDGQTSTAAEVDHVYLVDGEYPVKLTTRIGSNSDTQTSKISVSRLFARINDPPGDLLPAQAKIVESYDVEKLPANVLPRVVVMHQRSERFDVMFTAANRLANIKSHPDAGAALAAMLETSKTGIAKNRVNDVLAMWDLVPRDSDLQPRAARYQADYLLWWAADFAHAVRNLKDVDAKKDEGATRLYGQAMVLNNQVEAGRKLLLSLPTKEPQRHAALSGAMARSIEFHIDQKDADAGEEVWERWQARYPADFMEGYSLLLQTKLIELRNQPEVAAKVAVAFATAVPDSPYAPQLLDRASKLLEKSDLKQSESIRQTLKQRYPEDPLSQN